MREPRSSRVPDKDRQDASRTVNRPTAEQPSSARSAALALQRQAGNQAFTLAVQRARRSASPEPSQSSRRVRRMHPEDRGREFEIANGRSTIIGIYVRTRSNGNHVFDTRRHGPIEAEPHEVIGLRATHGGMHPPGRRRPPEENLEGRDRIYLSEGNLSAASARLRRDDRFADRMATTSFEEEPDYADYPQNRDDLARRGVPHFPGMDLSDRRHRDRLRNAPPGANLEFMMPRVPRGTRGYSTQQLIRDTNRIPSELRRSDLTTSVTTPHPSSYSRPGTHDRIYGMQSRRALRDTDMEVYDEGGDSDLDDYGYEHRESTVDRPADVAHRRHRYHMRPSRRYDDYDSDSD